MRRFRSSLAALLLLAVASGVAASANGASSSVVVSMSVPSATSLGNQCISSSATEFGVVQPGTSALTATGAGACAVTFSSSNDTAALRIGTADAQGTTMGSPSDAWATARTTGIMLKSVERSSAAIGLAGGFTGEILRTLDGGATWTGANALPTGDYIFDIDHLPGSDDTWVVAGGKGSISSTTNAATSAPAAPTWTDHRAALLASGWPSSAHVEGVAVLSATTWLVAGSGGWMARTTDAGANWSAYTIPGIVAFQDVAAVDANTVYATGSNAALLKTTTGGTNAAAWTTYTHTCGCWFQELSIADPTHVYASSDSGTVVRWDGTSFASSHVLADRAFQPYSVSSPAANPDVVYLTTIYGKVLKSTDKALSFVRQETPAGGYMGDIDAATATDVIAVGPSGTIVRTTDGASWALVREDATRRPLQHVDAHPSDGQRAVAVGARGTILRSVDSGATWSTQPSGSTANLNAVTWITSTRLVAVGSSGTVLVSSDGGDSWTARSSGTTQELFDVTHGDDGHVWAVGTGGTVLHSTGYGDAWSAQPSGTTRSLTKVAAWGTQVVFAGGIEGALRHSSDGGATWAGSTGTFPGWEAATGAAATSATTIWIGSRFSGLYRSTDGGASFSAVGSFPGGSVDELDALAGTITTIDRWGAWRISRDGGATWTSGWTHDGMDFNAVTGVALTDPHTLVVVNDLGGTRQQDEDTAASSRIPDYSVGANFASGASTGTFGVCLQSLAAATPAAGWVVDGGTCTASDADPWEAVPTAPATVATTTTGVTGSATFVWGVAPRSDQPAGTYRASIVFEAIAPAA